MSWEIWFAFALAAGIILVIPGPTIILVISQAISHGKQSVIPLMLGVVLGDFTAMLLSLLGLGALLTLSAWLFTVIKWLGAVYLVYLGITLWRTKPESGDISHVKVPSSRGALFKSSYIVTSLNPKGIVFFIAFLPQFVNHQAPVPGQLLVLGVTFLLLAGINAALYAVFAGQLRDLLQGKAVRTWFNRCGGTALIGAGVITAAMKKM